MQDALYRRQQFIARIAVAIACWIGTFLGLFWVKFGLLNLRSDAIWNRYVNPLLLIDGLVVWAACYGLYKMNRTVAVLVLMYALIQEVLLQQYTVQLYGHVIFKPYFPFEVLALVLGVGGVFWYHWAGRRIHQGSRKQAKKA